MATLNESGKWTYTFRDGERTATFRHFSTREREERALYFNALATRWQAVQGLYSFENLEALHKDIMRAVAWALAEPSIERRIAANQAFQEMLQRIDGAADMAIFVMEFLQEEGIIKLDLEDGEEIPTAKDVEKMDQPTLEKLGENSPESESATG